MSIAKATLTTQNAQVSLPQEPHNSQCIERG